MEITFTKEIEAKLHEIASGSGRSADQVVIELVAGQLDYQEWFKREVEKGIASLDSNEFVGHEEVGRRMEQLLGS